MNFESLLRKYNQDDREVQLKARRLFLSNIVMLLAAVLSIPFSLNETILLPLLLVAAAIGFSGAIFLVLSGRLAISAILHIVLTTSLIAFLYLFVSNDYRDALTFLTISFILIIDAVIVSHHFSLLFLLSVVAFFSQVAAPVLNLNGNLAIKPEYQLENIVLFLIFTSLVFFVYRDFTGLIGALKSEIRRSGKHEKSVSSVNRKLLDSEEKYRLLVENARDAIFIAQDGLFMFANKQTSEILHGGGYCARFQQPAHGYPGSSLADGRRDGTHAPPF